MQDWMAEYIMGGESGLGAATRLQVSVGLGGGWARGAGVRARRSRDA